ncbi:7592_t:CDS:2 [Cetraspora pellucida]|uniref:7592_t:CDS:1 n=1 Tax=Cetraspora pellucida TaxID=1433469 RepID=A0A9N9CHC0_9GLOM|nr:7592_t:CDS:2 [Cetraspora pellucida]
MSTITTITTNENKNSGNEDKTMDDANNMMGVIVIKSYKINSELNTYFIQLPRNNKLDDIRKILLKNEYDSDNDLYMGSNCRFLHFLQDKAEIKPDDESKFRLLDIVDQKDGKHRLYIIQKAEFDLTQLKFEKGFKFNKDSSVTSAYVQAFKINFDKIKINKQYQQHEKVYECNHETTAECKRSLIFDVNLSAAFPEWVSASIKLSHENSGQILKQHMMNTRHSCERAIRGVIPILNENIIIETKFKEDVKNVVNDTTNDNKISKLCEISEKYGHFYARRLILGGTRIRNEEYTKNSAKKSKAKATNLQGGVEIASILKSEVNVVHDNMNMDNNYHDNTNNFETIIGGTENSQNKDLWRQSLNDETKWKIIGYAEVYSLFELLDNELKTEVLNIMGHQILEAKIDEISFNTKKYEKDKKPYIYKELPKIKNISECNILASIVSKEYNVFSLHVDYMGGDKNRPVIVIHHIQGEKTIISHNKVKEVKIKLGWIIVGPQTSFDFSTKYPPIFKSKKYKLLKDEVPIISNDDGMFGTCVLEAINITQAENSSDKETDTFPIEHDPSKFSLVTGNYLIRKEPACQELAQWFVYDIKKKEPVTNEEVLKRFVFDKTNSHQVEIKWKNRPNKKILYSSEGIKISNDSLILVNQIFNHDDCEDCQPLGFINIIADKIFYGSLNSENSKRPNVIVYLPISLKSIAEK